MDAPVSVKGTVLHTRRKHVRQSLRTTKTQCVSATNMHTAAGVNKRHLCKWLVASASVVEFGIPISTNTAGASCSTGVPHQDVKKAGVYTAPTINKRTHQQRLTAVWSRRRHHRKRAFRLGSVQPLLQLQPHCFALLRTEVMEGAVLSQRLAVVLRLQGVQPHKQGPVAAHKPGRKCICKLDSAAFCTRCVQQDAQL